jgi:hypothetical protein
MHIYSNAIPNYVVIKAIDMISIVMYVAIEPSAIK